MKFQPGAGEERLRLAPFMVVDALASGRTACVVFTRILPPDRRCITLNLPQCADSQARAAASVRRLRTLGIRHDATAVHAASPRGDRFRDTRP